MSTYTNPVYGEYFADPFVLHHDGRYWAYGSAPDATGTVPALQSDDLVHWTRVGDVLEPLPGGVGGYWAPEVASADGRFYMYYSAGGAEGEGHQLRVALAEDPAGPFLDGGRVLDPGDAFTIDAHPFRDDDGTWYLFYARDFLDGDRPGTGIVVDTLRDMQTLRGDRRVVVRAFADWNLFLAPREWYGRIWDAWYTVEGPTRVWPSRSIHSGPGRSRTRRGRSSFGPCPARCSARGTPPSSHRPPATATGSCTTGGTAPRARG